MPRLRNQKSWVSSRKQQSRYVIESLSPTLSECHTHQVRLKDLNSNFLEVMASQLLYDNVEDMLTVNSMQANDVVAVVILSRSPSSQKKSVTSPMIVAGKNFAKAMLHP